MSAPDPEAIHAFFRFSGALAALTGAMAWFTRKGTPEEDHEVSEANDIVIGTVIDGDMVNRIDLRTGRNLRDQVTVEQLEEMNKERKLRRFDRRN